MAFLSMSDRGGAALRRLTSNLHRGAALLPSGHRGLTARSNRSSPIFASPQQQCLHLRMPCPSSRTQLCQRRVSSHTTARAIDLVLSGRTQASSIDAAGTPFTLRTRAILPLRIVEHPVVKRMLPLLGNAAYLALASGFVMTDILTLRSLLVLGYSGLVCFHLLHPRPLRIPLGWSAVFVTVNAAMVVKLALERWPMGLSESDEVIRSAFFERCALADACPVE